LMMLRAVPTTENLPVLHHTASGSQALIRACFLLVCYRDEIFRENYLFKAFGNCFLWCWPTSTHRRNTLSWAGRTFIPFEKTQLIGLPSL
jgi:glycopeptide antibiotics resistance protein